MIAFVCDLNHIISNQCRRPISCIHITNDHSSFFMLCFFNLTFTKYVKIGFLVGIWPFSQSFTILSRHMVHRHIKCCLGLCKLRPYLWTLVYPQTSQNRWKSMLSFILKQFATGFTKMCLRSLEQLLEVCKTLAPWHHILGPFHISQYLGFRLFCKNGSTWFTWNFVSKLMVTAFRSM